MSLLINQSARHRAEDRARILSIFSTNKMVVPAILGKLPQGEPHTLGRLNDDISEMNQLVARLPAPDLADTWKVYRLKNAMLYGIWLQFKSAVKCWLKPQPVFGTI